MSTAHVESAVKEAYASGAESRVEELWCSVDYDPRFLKAIPTEVIERDYGCGDPSQYLRSGETVLDLGSGTGKICFIAAQVVAPEGRVIGVDMTSEMLEVARRNAPLVAEEIGYANADFRRSRIQDLGLDLDRLEICERPMCLGAPTSRCGRALRGSTGCPQHCASSKVRTGGRVHSLSPQDTFAAAAEVGADRV
jgi:SAM-dependent methyltransferase